MGRGCSGRVSQREGQVSFLPIPPRESLWHKGVVNLALKRLSRPEDEKGDQAWCHAGNVSPDTGTCSSHAEVGLQVVGGVDGVACGGDARYHVCVLKHAVCSCPTVSIRPA